MRRDHLRRLEDLESELPDQGELVALRETAARRRLEERIGDRTATREDFAAVVGPDLDERRAKLLVEAGRIRHRRRRGLRPVGDGAPLTVAAEVVSYGPGEDLPEGLLDSIVAAAADPSSCEWPAANEGLVLLGEDHGERLRRDRHEHAVDFDPQHQVLVRTAERRPCPWPGDYAAKIVSGRASPLTFSCFFPIERDLYRTDPLVEAVGRREARLAGHPVDVVTYADHTAELLSYFPEETPPSYLWTTIHEIARSHPSGDRWDDWFNASLQRTLMGPDEGRSTRRLFKTHYEEFAAEARYLASNEPHRLTVKPWTGVETAQDRTGADNSGHRVSPAVEHAKRLLVESWNHPDCERPEPNPYDWD